MMKIHLGHVRELTSGYRRLDAPPTRETRLAAQRDEAACEHTAERAG